MDIFFDENIYEVKNYYKNNSAFFKLFAGSSDIVCNELKKGNIWEKDLSSFIEKNIKKTDVVLEAGTHVGSHTIKLCLLSETVYGFEPFPLSYELINKNIEINKIDNLKIFKNALSNEIKEVNVEFHNPLNRNVGGWGLNFDINNEGNSSDNNIIVNCLTIDSLNLNKLDFIKLDVEGFEKEALLGGINTIKKFKPIIIFENWGENQSINIDETNIKFSFLTNIGYTINYLNGDYHNGCPDYVAMPN
jgi:FkbM family methyltransferase